MTRMTRSTNIHNLHALFRIGFWTKTATLIIWTDHLPTHEFHPNSMDQSPTASWSTSWDAGGSEFSWSFHSPGRESPYFSGWRARGADTHWDGFRDVGGGWSPFHTPVAVVGTSSWFNSSQQGRSPRSDRSRTSRLSGSVRVHIWGTSRYGHEWVRHGWFVGIGLLWWTGWRDLESRDSSSRYPTRGPLLSSYGLYRLITVCVWWMRFHIGAIEWSA